MLKQCFFITVLLKGAGDLGIFFKGAIAFYMYIWNPVSFKECKISPYVPEKGNLLPEVRLEDSFLCMCKDAASSMLSWMWMKTLSHNLTCRIASHSWVPAPSAWWPVLCLKSREQSSSGAEGGNCPVLLRGQGLCMFYSVIWRGCQDRAHFPILNLKK